MAEAQQAAGHTPEPWAAKLIDYRDDEIEYRITAVGRLIGVLYNTEFGTDQTEANARRVVAAVNAAKGIPVEALEAGVVAELVAACKPVLAEAKERADYMHDTWNPEAHVVLTLTIAELRAIRATVDKAEGRTP